MFFLLVLIIALFGLLIGLVMVLLASYLIWHKSPYVIFKCVVLVVGIALLITSSHFILHTVVEDFRLTSIEC